MSPRGRFIIAGAAAAACAAALAVWLGDGASGQRSGLIAAGALVAGDVLAALWAPGGEERKRRPLAWARVGLAAAMGTFVGLWLLVLPIIILGVSDPSRAYAALGLGAVLGALVVWITHVAAWRRIAPKDGAPKDGAP